MTKSKISGKVEELTIPELDELVRQCCSTFEWTPMMDDVLYKYKDLLRTKDLGNHFGCSPDIVTKRLIEKGWTKKRIYFKKDVQE